MNADTFNLLYPVGTRVRAFPETRAETPHITRTESRAWDVQHGLTVVRVAGITMPLRLSHVDPLPDEYTPGGTR